MRGTGLIALNPLPLDDLRVLDLTHYYNGPYATMLLSYLGAEVIKIEGPPYGDGMRALYRAEGKPFGMPFALMNSNKRAITLNLKSDEGRAIFKKLVLKADIVVENFAAGTPGSMGLRWGGAAGVHPAPGHSSGPCFRLALPHSPL